ncbi:MAG: TerB family tellurite resistance protein [Prevotella sp.]|nr:TerB family tellurite resistance protein [Prevotella sp.]
MAIAGKLIGGFLGFITGGPLGALAGVIFGSLFDSLADVVNTPESRRWEDNYEETHSERRNARSQYEQYRQYQQRQYEQYRQRQYEGQRNSFIFSLLVLASYIIRADGKIMHSEMELVRQFLRTNFGEEGALEGEQILRKLFDEQKRQNAQNPYAFRNTIRQSCEQIAQNMDYSQRLQLLNFLVLIAQADGHVATEEINALKEVTQYLQMSQEDLESMLNLRNASKGSLDDAYKVLGISKDATDDEVKAAYRKMALKHHPDRVATLGDDVKKAAEKKFKEINEAKERIYKARGM